MNTIFIRTIAGVAVCMAAPANAALVINIIQIGANVTTAISGSFDLSGLTVSGTGSSISNVLKGTTGFIGSGVSGATKSYTGLTGPSSFGPGTTPWTATSNKTGSAFVLNASVNTTNLPVVSFASSYVSGAAFASTSTFDKVTIAFLGLKEGQYIFRSSNDTITVNIGNVPAVPEPATWGMMLLGFGAVGVTLRCRRKHKIAAMPAA